MEHCIIVVVFCDWLISPVFPHHHWNLLFAVLIAVILVEVRGYLIVAVICTSLIISGFAQFFIFLLLIYIFIG